MWKNLAPNLYRQRLLIEGTTKVMVGPKEIKTYLLELADVTKMEVLAGPFVDSAHEMGWAGWIHWKTSGTHFYSYSTDHPLFTVDTYTCKFFDAKKLVDFTQKYFSALEIAWKEIKV